MPAGSHTGGRQWGRRRSLTLLLLIAAVGLAVRLYALEGRTITDEEIHVPRISFPLDSYYPPQRLTLPEVLHGTMEDDNHPPGYYLIMWLWTGLFGTGLASIRLPSVLAGTATILLLYRLLRPGQGELIAFTAAALLALNGYHVFWSQQARMWTLLPLLSVLSLLLLRRLNRGFSPATALLYVLTAACGLWVEYSFWPFFAAQAVWQLWRSWRERQAPALLGLQHLALVLASPVLLFFLRAQSGRTRYISTDISARFREMLRMGWLVTEEETLGTLAERIPLLLVLLEIGLAVLLIAGLLNYHSAIAGGSGRSPALRLHPAVLPSLGAARAHLDLETLSPSGDRASRRFLSFALPAAGAAATAICLGLQAVAGGHAPPWPAMLLPAALAACWYPLARVWRLLPSRRQPSHRPGFFGRLLDDEINAHLALTLLLFFGLSLLVPCLTMRGFLVVVPFGLALLARGASGLFASRAARSVLAALLLMLSAGSVVLYARTPSTMWDYKGLVEEMRPSLHGGDPFVLPENWYSQPIIYYLSPAEHPTLRPKYLNGWLRNSGGERVWIVFFVKSHDRVGRHLDSLSGMLREHGFRRECRARVRYGVAELWVKSGSDSGEDTALPGGEETREEGATE